MPDISYIVDSDSLVNLGRLFKVGNNAHALKNAIALSICVAGHCDDNGLLTVLDRQGLPVKINLRG